jgi:hypothetical protein
MSESEGNFHCHAPNPKACPFCNLDKTITVGNRIFPECHDFENKCFFKIPTKFDMPPDPSKCNCIRKAGDTGTCPIHNSPTGGEVR